MVQIRVWVGLLFRSDKYSDLSCYVAVACCFVLFSCGLMCTHSRQLTVVPISQYHNHRWREASDGKAVKSVRSVRIHTWCSTIVRIYIVRRREWMVDGKSVDPFWKCWVSCTALRHVSVKPVPASRGDRWATCMYRLGLKNLGPAADT